MRLDTVSFLSMALLGAGCEASKVVGGLDTAEPLETSIVGPYPSGLFQSLCVPKVSAAMSGEISDINRVISSQLLLDEGPVRIQGHTQPLDDGERTLFYDDGTRSISGYPETNAWYASGDSFNLGCVGTWIYQERSEDDSELGLYGGSFTVYYEDDQNGELRWTVVWTSSLGAATEDVVAYSSDGVTWETWTADSGRPSPVPDWHEALAALSNYVQSLGEATVVCDSGAAFADDCHVIE